MSRIGSFMNVLADWSPFISKHLTNLNDALATLRITNISLKGITSNGQPKDIITKLAQAGVTGFNMRLAERIDHLFKLGASGRAGVTNIGSQLSQMFVALGGTIDSNAPIQDDTFSGKRDPSKALNDVLKPNKNSLASKSPSPAGGAPNMGDLFKDAGKRPA